MWLAREGHDGPIGINYLRKIEIPLPAACYGAILAGVDAVLVGAGNPADLPPLLRSLARHEDVALPVRVQGARSDDPPAVVTFSPTGIVARSAPGVPAPLPVPWSIAIVASLDLAAGLAADPQARPDGFVVEAPSAGGHNAPPRGPHRTDELDQPVYGDRDEVDLAALVGIGLPVWLAGSRGSPQGLAAARAVGAVGIQVGTAFALCRESGLADPLKRQVLDQVRTGRLDVRSDWRVSPTGFPFRVAQLDGTLSDPAVHASRPVVCDLGVLRSPFRTDDGTVDYRCPAEPPDIYLRRKGGRPANIEGRRCLCNALMAAMGLPQERRSGYVEPPIVTLGSDLSTVAHLIADRPADAGPYPAADVMGYLHSVG